MPHDRSTSIGGQTIKTNRVNSGQYRTLILGLAVYFFVSVIFRVMVSSTADMDETELLVFTQVLKLGYGSQLPLYAWLQYLSFTLFGVNIFALSILKYGLLFSTYLCVLKVSDRVLQDRRCATTATLSLFLIPQIAWESYRTLTNTVLATFLAALTLLLFLEVRDKPGTVNYALLGAACGLGMLSKYNYAIFFLSLLTAGLTIPSFRPTIVSSKSILSLAIMTAITAPSYIWIAGNFDRATASSGKLKALGSDGFVSGVVMGLFSLTASWIGYFWPALLVFGLFYFLSKPVREGRSDEEAHLLLRRILGASFIICSVLVLFFGVTYFKERWMQPILFFLPVFFMHFLYTRLDKKRFRRLLVVTLTPSLLALVAFSGGVLLASKTGRATRLSPPYQELAAGIRDAGFGGGTIITDDHRIGGNFRLFFKKSTVIVPGMADPPTHQVEPTLILWNANRSDPPPRELMLYVKEKFGTGVDPARISYVREPMLYWKEKTMRLGYVIVKGR